MKQLILLITLLAFSTSGFTTDYKEAMAQNIQKMYQSASIEELTNVANQFERIGQKQKNEWLPGYYAAYSYVSILFSNRELSAEKKSGYLKQAQEHIKKIMKIAPTESEIYVLQALVYQMHITNPAEGYTYASMASEALAKAEVFNPKNPRVYYLKGLNLYYTPEEYGGGKEAALPNLKKAKDLFDQVTGEPSLMPSWGSEHNTMLINQ